MCTEAGPAQNLRCRYHGRRFALDGKFLSMPEFEQARGFPSAADDLPRIALQRLGPLLFAGVDPFAPFDELVAPVLQRIDFLDKLAPDPSGARAYEVAAN